MARDIKLPLTESQKKTLIFIIGFLDSHDYPPTILEIGDHLGFNNPGYIYKILKYLEKKNYITREKGKHRSIRLTDIGESITKTKQLDLFEM